VKAWQAVAAVVAVFFIGTMMLALNGPNEPIADSAGAVTQLNDTTGVRVPAVGASTSVVPSAAEKK
jgi:hypothetical protein